MNPRFYIGIFCKSFAILMFEVSLTRILSVSLWHHFAFLIISCALMGYALSGSFLIIFPRIQRAFYPAFLFSLTLIPVVWAANTIEIKPALLTLSTFHWFALIGIFFIFLFPFFFSGLAINILFRNSPQKVNKLYFFDLSGAAFGCGAFFVIAPIFPSEQWICIQAGIGFCAALLLADKPIERGVSLLGLFSIILLATFSIIPPLQMNNYKSLPAALRLKNSHHLDKQWNSASQVDWFQSPLSRQAPGLSLNYQGDLPEQIGIAIDGDQITSYIPFNAASRKMVEWLPDVLPFKLRPENNQLLILNAIGGNALLPALDRSAHITMQTENAILADWHRRKPYSSAVNIELKTARSFLSNNEQVFDKIFFSLESSLPSGFSGIDSLNSNPLFTLEGIELAFDKLTPQGWLVFHTYLLPPPRAELKLLTTIFEILQKKDLAPKAHIGILQTISTLLIVLSPNEWSPNQTQIFHEFCDSRSFIPIHYPGVSLNIKQKALSQSPLYAKSIYALLEDSEKFQQSSPFNLTPATDNRPYFNFFIKFSRFYAFLEQFDFKWEAAIEGGLLAGILLLLITLISIPTIGFPFIAAKKQFAFFNHESIYFIWIGLGFMFAEIAAIEVLTMYLGEPVYSFAIVLSTLLVCAGLGSLNSSRVVKTLKNKLFIILIMALFIYGLLFQHLITHASGLSLSGRILLSVFCLFLIGTLMGAFFPLGIQKISKTGTYTENKIALAWCFNGLASVIGSIGALFVSQIFGLQLLFFLSAMFYGLAFWAFRR